MMQEALHLMLPSPVPVLPTPPGTQWLVFEVTFAASIPPHVHVRPSCNSTAVIPLRK